MSNPARRDELDTLGGGYLDEFLGELMLIDTSWHGLDRFRHRWSLP